MKATDLMIGDWVEVTQEGEKHFAKVQMIDGYGDNATADECVCDAIYYGIDELKPIQLTPEILEKNGWKSYSHENTPIFGIIQGFEIVLAWMDYYWQLCVDGTLYRKIRIRYVHELQHALKLCGIEKEIVL